MNAQRKNNHGDFISRKEIDNFKTNIYKKLAQLNIKLPKLAELIGIPYQSLWRIVNEESYSPNISSLYLIADFFEVSLGDLLVSPNLPQYIPILKLSEIKIFLKQNYFGQSTSQILSDEYIHEQAFAITVNQNQYGMNFTSTFIFRPSNKVQMGIFIISLNDIQKIVNITSFNNEIIKYVDFQNGQSCEHDATTFEIEAIAVKQIVKNDLI